VEVAARHGGSADDPTVRIVRCISSLRDGSLARPTRPVTAACATPTANSGVTGLLGDCEVVWGAGQDALGE
jgi:hypothetical protein